MKKCSNKGQVGGMGWMWRLGFEALAGYARIETALRSNGSASCSLVCLRSLQNNKLCSE